jgi:hypothetical protein
MRALSLSSIITPFPVALAKLADALPVATRDKIRKIFCNSGGVLTVNVYQEHAGAAEEVGAEISRAMCRLWGGHQTIYVGEPEARIGRQQPIGDWLQAVGVRL